MIRHFQTLIKTAYIEWSIQVRQLSTWMLAGLLFLVGWLSVDRESLPLLSAASIARSTAEGLGGFGGLFAVVLAASGFSREFRISNDFFWSRTFSVNSYIVGKFLGIWMVISTALIPVGLWVAAVEIGQYGSQGIVIQAQLWTFILAPTFLSIFSVTLLIGLVIRRSLWVSLLMVLITGGVLAASLDITHLLSVAPYNIYVSPLIGYGPDSRLLESHRAFYFFVSVFNLLLGLLTVSFTAPRLEGKKAQRCNRIAWGALSIGVLAVIFYVGINFQHESDAISVEPNPASYQRGWLLQDCSNFRSYRVELSIDYQTGHVEGEAYIELNQVPSSRLPFDLNDGLQITNATTSPRDITVKVDENTLLFGMAEQSTSVTLEYVGALQIPRYLYDRLFRPEIELTIEPYFWPGGYVHGKALFLTRDGNWHPFPGCPLDALKVVLKGMPLYSPIAHTADVVVYSSGRSILAWERRPPLALFSTSPYYQETQLGEGVLLTAPASISSDEIERVFAPYFVLMQQIDVYLQQEGTSNSRIQVVMIPLIGYGKYDPSSGILFLPETDYLPMRYQGLSFTDRKIDSPDLLYKRWVAERMVRLWWCSDDICTVPQVASYGSSRWLSNANEDNRTVLNALLFYTALRLSEPLVGQEFVTEEMALHYRVASGEMLVERLGLPWAFYPTEINRLIVVLDKVWEEAGAQSFWRLIREYHRLYGDISISVEEFGHFVKQMTGITLP